MPENIQDALKPTPLKRPMDRSQMGGDVAALNSLIKLMNDPRITGAEVPKGVVPNDNPILARENAKYPGTSHAYDDKPLRVEQDATGATMIAVDPAVSAIKAKAPVAPATPVADMPTTVRNPAKIFYTGLIGVGKDYVAEATNAAIFGFADPIYHLAEYFFGITVNSKTGKDIPGVRQFLQMAGQWGRAEVSEQYPLTPARACFISMIRSLGEAARFDARYEIDWSAFGRDSHFWVNGVVKRATAHLQANPTSRVASTNVRFQPEYKSLSGLGWTHYHVMCSPETRRSRVKALTDKDTTEAMANHLNNDVMKRISAQPTGAKLRVIWNDTAKIPSPRLYTLSEFLQAIAIDEVPDTIVMTGE